MMGLVQLERTARLAVFDPTPILTIAIEPGDERGPELHIHPGGQGVWVTHMASALGAEVVLCAGLGGEPGHVLASELGRRGIDLRAVRLSGRTGSYVHDRRSGARVELSATKGPRFTRHECDELYGIALAAALDAGRVMLTGPRDSDAVPGSVYRRLAGDLRANGVTVMGDVAADHLMDTLAGGLDLLKISCHELIEAGLAEPGDDETTTMACAEELARLGAEAVVVSRGADPAIALVEKQHYAIEGPRLEASDPQGTGDSMFAAIGVGLAGGLPMLDALRLGAAAGALNVTRRGMGTGRAEEVWRLMAHVHLRPLDRRRPIAD